MHDFMLERIKYPTKRALFGDTDNWMLWAHKPGNSIPQDRHPGSKVNLCFYDLHVASFTYDDAVLSVKDPTQLPD